MAVRQDGSSTHLTSGPASTSISDSSVHRFSNDTSGIRCAVRASFIAPLAEVENSVQRASGVSVVRTKRSSSFLSARANLKDEVRKSWWDFLRPATASFPLSDDAKALENWTAGAFTENWGGYSPLLESRSHDATSFVSSWERRARSCTAQRRGESSPRSSRGTEATTAEVSPAAARAAA